MNRRTPVIIAGTNCLSGVTTWADRVRAALTNHPRYHVQLLHVGTEERSDADIVVPTVDDACTLLRGMTPAIVIPNYIWSLFLSGFDYGIRCIGMCHADSEEEYYRPLGWYEPAVAKYIAVSQECDARLKGFVPIRKHDVEMLPYGVCVPALLRRNYQNRPLRMIYAGRVTQPQKRVWDFVPLVEQLLRAKVSFEFDIVGEGDEFAPLQQMMRARVPAANVRFHPRVPHSAMANIWLDHDIFLQVSDFEGTSISMLEAMAHGVVPVVTAASSGVTGVITPQENGYIVPVGDMKAMAAAIASLSNEESLLAEMGPAAYRTAQAYSMDLYARKFVKILDDVDNMDIHAQIHTRYGVYSPQHPLIVQRQQMAQQQPAPSTQAEQKALKQLFKDGLKKLRRPKSKNNKAA